MTPAALADLVRSTAHDVLTGHGLDPAALPETVTLRRPREPTHGEYATNVALQAARKAGVAARELAGWLALELAQHDGLRRAEVAGPGFLNLWLRTETRGEIVAQVLAAGESFRISQNLAGHRVKAIVEELIGHRASMMTDLVAAVGADAARYALIRSPHASPVNIDLKLWSRRTHSNPVFCVQYAHARLVALARNAVELGISSTNAQLCLLDHERESELIRTLGEFPRVIASAAQLRQPHRVVRYLDELADAYYRFSDACRVLPQGEEQEKPPDPRHAARLALCAATRQVLANGLSLLGVSAPERM